MRHDIEVPLHTGLIIECESDFLTNDVSIYLASGSKVFPKTRSEGAQRVVAETLPTGNYTLLIYAMNSLSNF